MLPLPKPNNIIIAMQFLDFETTNNIYILYIIIKRFDLCNNELSRSLNALSNDVEVYEAFFSKTFSECVSSTYDSQTPDNIRHFPTLIK